jgi:hypothetical protein
LIISHCLPHLKLSIVVLLVMAFPIVLYTIVYGDAMTISSPSVTSAIRV